MQVFYQISIILIAHFVVFSSLAAQNPLIARHTMNIGMPSNVVYQVYQDKDGFIWFATDSGAARFDGKNYKYITIKDGLNTNEIVKIQEDSYGRLWLFNLNGTFNFIHKNKVFNNTNAPFLAGLSNGFLFKSFYEDREGIIYFYQNLRRDIFVLDTLNKINKFHLKSDKKYIDDQNRSMERNFTNSVTKIKDKYYFYKSSGLYVSDEINGKCKSLDTTLIMDQVFSIDDSTKMVYGYHKKLKEKILVKYINFKAEKTIFIPFGKEERHIVSIFSEEDDTYWISCFFSGVYVVKNGKVIRHFDIRKPQNIIFDNDNNIWISSMIDGVFKLNKDVFSQKHFSLNEFDNKGVVSLSSSQLGGVWVTNGQSIYLVKEGKVYSTDFFKEDGTIDRIIELENKSLVLGESNLNLYAIKGIKFENKRIRYNEFQTFKDRAIKDFVVNRGRNEITAFYPYILYRIDQENLFSNFKEFKIDSERIYKVFYNYKNDLLINGQSLLHFYNGEFKPYEKLSSLAGKILRNHLILNDSLEVFNVGGDSLYLLTTNDFINLNELFIRTPDELIKDLDYGNSTLFMAGSSKIYFLENPLTSIHNTSLELRTLDIRFNNIQKILVQGSDLIVASDEGLTFIPIISLDVQDVKPPKPYFHDIFIDDTKVSEKSTIANLSGETKFQFNLGCIHYKAGQEIFIYKLDGADSKWNYGNDISIVYPSLSPGNYVFRFKVRTADSKWSEEERYEIFIKRLWWHHPLFLGLLIFGILALIFIFLLREKQRDIKNKEMEHQILLHEQKALHSMMNPHFIFNTLGSIQSYILKNKPQDAGLYLSQFARLIRQNLNATKYSMIDLEEEVERLRNYLMLERLRMNNSFNFTITLDASIDEGVMIPTMIIQPIVENAVWHGVAEIESDGRIDIVFSKFTEDIILIVVEDNGIGVKKSSLKTSHKESHLRLGMDLTRKRLALLGDKMKVETSIVTMEAFPGNDHPGTSVVIKVPCSYSVSEI